MYLLIGLGNPGIKYRNNRHNVGFMFLDWLITTHYVLLTTHFSKDKYSSSEIATINLNKSQPISTSLKILLAKPQTFMNNSGPAVRRLISTNLNQSLSISTNIYKSQLISPYLPISNIFIVHDDLDIRLGNFKIQKGVGPKVHNGISSIEQALKTKDFWRIRIGVDNREPGNKISGEKYVLSDFNEKERKILDETFPKIQERLVEFLINKDQSTS